MHYKSMDFICEQKAENGLLLLNSHSSVEFITALFWSKTLLPLTKVVLSSVL